MSISDLYPTGEHEQNLAHFSSLVRIAMRENQINSKERFLLDRLSMQLDISSNEYNEILKNPSKYPMVAPVSYDERLEHLFDLTKMMFLDKNPTIDKTSMMDRIAIELGFPAENVRQIVKAAITFFLKEPEFDDFKNVIKKANPIKH